MTAFKARRYLAGLVRSGPRNTLIHTIKRQITLPIPTMDLVIITIVSWIYLYQLVVLC